ncbi:hypothetical protein Hanom_Chr04g00298001 [Helianthus anomalus]
MKLPCKTKFSPPMKFMFHTLLTSISNKTIAFNGIPLKVQYLGYAILTNTNFNYSQALFTELVNNLKHMKKWEKCCLSHVSKTINLLLAKTCLSKSF